MKTEVRGVRAKAKLWQRLNELSQSENITRNELIVREMTRYCKERESGKLQGFNRQDSNSDRQANEDTQVGR